MPKQAEIAVRPAWPEDPVLPHLVLDLEERLLRALKCHPARLRPSFPPHPHPEGPVELPCRLAHCSDRLCTLRCQTLSPAAELFLTLPWWTIAWDVFCWMLVWTSRPDRVSPTGCAGRSDRRTESAGAQGVTGILSSICPLRLLRSASSITTVPVPRRLPQSECPLPLPVPPDASVEPPRRASG